ncbi:MAG: VWA domain-containing protein [Aliivibrio sp.]|uniref:vWA domain-containing protein n=1 Tax=Aliivibrio sp. TaxID=1872443 RepID=UPI001A3D72A3|nr:VWA domain-containing protein [Aliivibrio sp.]
MFSFIWWWMWLLLPLPYIVRKLLPRVTTQSTVQLPTLPKGIEQVPSLSISRVTVISLLWVSLLTAAARPVWYGDPVQTQPLHRDLMLTVDLSGSMSQQDMLVDGDYVDRLTSVKSVLSEFISKRKGDRLGLVLFADHAYLQTPLTFDIETVSEQLNRTVFGLVGKLTAIGEGIGIATKTFINSEAPQRVIVLLSDGTNTAGVIEPLEAAQLAQKSDVTIYTVGVGAGEMKVKSFFGSRTVNTAQDLDESTLTKIAEITGGQYFRARNQQDLNDIYEKINALEPIASSKQTWRPSSEWFRFPLMLALLLSVSVFIVRSRDV